MGRGPAIVLLHAGVADRRIWAEHLAPLAAAGHRVIAVDLPGFGDSVKPLRAPFDAPYFARAMTAVLDAAGIERAHVVGNSMGGRVGIELGLTAPDRSGRIALRKGRRTSTSGAATAPR